MEDLDSKLRNTELSIDKIIKHKNESLRKEALKKELNESNNKGNHQIVPAEEKTKLEIKRQHAVAQKNVNKHIKNLFLFCLKNYNQHNVQKLKLNINTLNGKANLTSNSNSKLKFLKLLKKLKLIKNTSYKISKNKHIPESKDINNYYNAGHIIYKFSYTHYFLKIIRKYSHLKMFKFLYYINHFCKCIADNPLKMILGLFGSIFVISALLTWIFPTLFQAQLSHLLIFTIVNSIACGASITFVAILAFILFFCTIETMLSTNENKKAKEFLKHKKSIIKDLQKNVPFNVLNVLKKRCN